MDARGKFGVHERRAKELLEAQNLYWTEILHLNWICTRHFIEHGRAYIKISTMMAQ